MSIRIGIDTGGTFTDVMAYDDVTGQLLFYKVHSTPENPGLALVQGVGDALQKLDAGRDEISLLVHGTTVATNVILQRNGVRAALITTAGFRDILHIQRQNRPHLYDLRSRRAEPLIPRRWRFELSERIGPDGVVQKPVDSDQLHQIIEQLQAERIEAVAVAFLHSHENPSHELEVAQTLAEKLPSITVCTSHELARQIGEYERFSTCAMNAYVQPVMQRYLEQLDSNLSKQQIIAPLFVMKSNGGVMSASDVARECVQTILSGPAGGVVAGMAIARHHDNPNLITADMGGTSFDVAVIEQGQATFARDTQIGGLALRVPMFDLHTIGAGGGSIGWIDPGQSLRVGPMSASSVPGPACYGLGGTEPTVTDANLVLGRLAVQSKLAGGMDLDLEAARQAVDEKLATPLGLSIEAAAEGMIRVVNAAMVTAIRKLTVERGLDPRQFVMCPFGGAGPLHGTELAYECGITQTLVPLAPGVTSAMGLLMSNLREDRVVSHIALLDQIDASQLSAMLKQLEMDTSKRMTWSEDSKKLISTTNTLALRYLGQGHDVAVSMPKGPIDIDVIRRTFHEAHETCYGFSRPDQPVELVQLWVSIEINLQPLALPKVEPAKSQVEPIAYRPVIFNGQSLSTPIYDRQSLGAGCELVGPAIVEQLDTTVVIWPNQRGNVDTYGQIIVTYDNQVNQNQEIRCEKIRSDYT